MSSLESPLGPNPADNKGWLIRVFRKRLGKGVQETGEGNAVHVPNLFFLICFSDCVLRSFSINFADFTHGHELAHSYSFPFSRAK